MPSGFNWFLEFLAFLFFVNVVVAGLGTPAVAAFMSVLQLSSVAFMPSFALASAGAILVGQAIGGGRKDEVPRTVRVTFLAAGGWQVLVGILYLAVPALLLAPFARDPATAGPLLEVATPDAPALGGLGALRRRRRDGGRGAARRRATRPGRSGRGW